MADPKEGYNEGIRKAVIYNEDSVEPKEGWNQPSEVVVVSVDEDGDVSDG